ncbi:MAG: hypothetical protein K2X32_06195 [Phycisphaerales bacterium]|nr:hypothetical protein [Phycisphaerales bacterium]
MKCRNTFARPVVGPCHAALAGSAMLSTDARAGTPVLFEQIVNQPVGVGVFEPTLSTDGRRVAFRTTADLTGQNADRSVEVFVYDRDTRTTKQVTSTPGGGGTAITFPMITPDGLKVCFVSAFAFIPGSGNGVFNLWEVDVDSGAYRLVTNFPTGSPVTDPRMSGDGRFFSLGARINPNGGNPNGSLEVFRVDRVTGEIVQISDNGASVSATFFSDINGDGSVIVWGGRENYDATNGNGNQEIWKWKDNGDNTVTRSAATISAAAQSSEFPRVDNAGRYVVFNSLTDFSGGTATGRKTHLVDTQTGTYRRLTNPGSGGSGVDLADAEISPDGTKVYFEAAQNLTGSNSDGNRESYSYDIASDALSQLTNTTGGVSIISLSDDATRRYVQVANNGNIVYRTDRLLDPTVTNDGANLDLFIGACSFATVTPGTSTIDSGQSIALSAAVRVAGTSTYEWLRNGVAITDGAAGAAIGGGVVSGATGALASNQTVALTISGAAASDSGAYTVRVTGTCGVDIGSRASVTVNAPVQTRCNPADIAFDDGSPLPPIGVPGSVNNGVTEGDYNLFFATFFDAGAACDIANDDSSPLPPFGALATNNGVTEGDYNLFFAIFFDGCAF